MKTKLSVKKIVSLLLSLIMTLSILTASVSVADASEFFALYFKPNSNWLEADARFAVYQFDSAGNDEWVDMTLCNEEENIYTADINLSLYNNIIFAVWILILLTTTGTTDGIRLLILTI